MFTKRIVSGVVTLAFGVSSSVLAFYNDPNSATGVGVTAKVLTAGSMGLAAAGIATTYEAKEEAEEHSDDTSRKAWKASLASDATALGFFTTALVSSLVLRCAYDNKHAAAVAGGVLTGAGVLAAVPGIVGASIGTARSNQVSDHEKAGLGTTVATYVAGALSSGMFFWNAILLSRFMQNAAVGSGEPASKV